MRIEEAFVRSVRSERRVGKEGEREKLRGLTETRPGGAPRRQLEVNRSVPLRSGQDG